MWLTFLVSEHQRDLTFVAISLNQIRVKFLTIKQFEDEHFNEDKGGIDCRKYSLDRILTSLAILVTIICIISHCLENDSIRSYFEASKKKSEFY